MKILERWIQPIHWMRVSVIPQIHVQILKMTFLGRTVPVTTQQQRGHPNTRGLQIRERVHVQSGSFRGRCLRTRGGHGKRLASEALDEQQQPQAADSDQPPPQAPDNDQPQPQASDGVNAGVALSDSDDSWSEESPIIKNFPFTETQGMTVDVPTDADPMFFFFNVVENLVKNTNKYADNQCLLTVTKKVE